jgi:hypothetical protein
MVIVKIFLLCCGGDRAVEAVKEAVRQSGIDAKIEIVTNLAEAAKAGVFSNIAIKINNRIVGSGRVPSVQDLVTALTKAASAN